MSGAALAQFTGPSASHQALTVEEALEARPGTYATVTGNIIQRLREDYYIFRDATGEVRVEIDSNRWKGRRVDPETSVRLFVEVDRNAAGRRYLWVESIEIADPES